MSLLVDCLLSMKDLSFLFDTKKCDLSIIFETIFTCFKNVYNLIYNCGVTPGLIIKTSYTR